MPDKKKNKVELKDEALGKVVGGEAPDEIRVEIKTLEGENDDYKIALNDKTQKLIEKYSADKELVGNHQKTKI